MCKGIHTYFWLYTAVSGRTDWIRQITTTTPRAPLLLESSADQTIESQCSRWQWSKHSMWHQRLWWWLMMIKTLNMMPAGFQPEVARDPSRVHHLQLLQLFTRCAQLYKNSHGFPCPVKPSTKSAPRYFSSAGHVKSTVDPSRDTRVPPAAWTFYTAPHELY